ncbi:DUF305 domain-containing protein [Octadecabacter sp. SW4]|uniref:DUF305 domain-containing protein n=1 Tax=Octadecabacter sp. SW4 TaxID=2602067 RepID=UPI0020C7B9F6|nr:DUF305 domain-containing protein [Octadecabacter sp. SW4]
MLTFMLAKYRNRGSKLGIYAGSILLFVLALWLVRSQATVQDVSWIKAMIPHHSIAILTRERAELSDPRVQELATSIIKAQRGDIGQMEALVADSEGQ